MILRFFAEATPKWHNVKVSMVHTATSRLILSSRSVLELHRCAVFRGDESVCLVYDSRELLLFLQSQLGERQYVSSGYRKYPSFHHRAD